MIELREITILDSNVKECIELEVLPEQTKFVAHNASSLGQAYSTNSERGLGSTAVAYAIYADERMVGFIMYAFFNPKYEDDFNENKDYYYFWRFMVDKNHQGKGYGRAAMTQVINEVKQKPCGEAEHCYISYEPDNPMKKFYESFGFEETGQVNYGENVAKMKL